MFVHHYNYHKKPLSPTEKRSKSYIDEMYQTILGRNSIKRRIYSVRRWREEKEEGGGRESGGGREEEEEEEEEMVAVVVVLVLLALRQEYIFRGYC